MLFQARARAAPVTEEAAMRALTRLVAVRAWERFLLRSLSVSRDRKYTEPAPH